MRIATIKLKAIELGVEKIDAADKGGYLVFGEDTATDPVALVGLVQNQGDIYRLSGAHRLQFRLDLRETGKRFGHIENLLDTLAPAAVQTAKEPAEIRA